MPRDMQKSISVAVLLVAVVALAGCQNGAERDARDDWPDPAEAQRSEVLAEALGSLVGDYFEQTQGAADEAVEEYVRRLEVQHPRLLQVTSAMEERFEAGEFDSTRAMEAINRELRRIEILEARLPGFTAWLIDRYEAGQLADAQLEVAQRLIRATVQELEGSLWQF